MLIGIVVIVGAASGIIVFNFILVTWCLFCRRRHREKVELQTFALQKRSSLLKGKHVKFAASVLVKARNTSASYPAPRRGSLPFVPSPLASAKVHTRRSDRPRAENLFPQKLSTTPVMPTLLDCAPSVYSDDTASVYSVASAPLELHDRLLRPPDSSKVIPVASASGTSEMLSLAVVNPTDRMFPPWARHPLSVMEKELDPEVYSRAVQQRSRNLSDRPWHKQQSASCDASPYHSDWGQTPNYLLPPGLLVSPPQTIKNTGQELSPPSRPSPHSPPSK